METPATPFGSNEANQTVPLADASTSQPAVADDGQLNLIAVGASAGGLEALQELLSNLPPLPPSCVVVAQHLSPSHKSMLVQLLSRESKMVVREAEHGQRLEPDQVYITPPDKDITIVNGHIQLSRPSANVGPKPSVDVLLQSVAQAYGRRVISIILSGTGSDGASGVVAVKNHGGFVMVQEPDTAKYSGMPISAINTGVADVVMAPDKMGDEMLDYLQNPGQVREKADAASAIEGSALEKILRILSHRTGTDFSNYKPATIRRRLDKRLGMLNLHSLDDYLQLVEKNAREVDEMFNMILIGVTNFFRDTDAFFKLESYLRSLVQAKAGKEALRIWVPGCSTGEEAYSIAILLYRILQEKHSRVNVQIFATDIDENAISTARKGVYSTLSVEGVPTAILDQYFVKKGKEFELIKSVRSMVLFSKHDVTRNPPFLKLDLISCRNLLIYFGAALQQQIIPIFHYSLLPDGYLFLGKSETVGQFADLFATIDGKNKIFQRKRGGNLHAIKFSAFKAQKQLLPQAPVRKVRADLSIPELVKETLFNSFDHPYVVVNEQFDVQEINGDVRLFMTLPQGAVQVNLFKMINQELQIELRSVLTKAIKERESIRSTIRKFELFGGSYFVRLVAKPLLYSEASDDLYLVVFERLELDDYLTKNDADGLQQSSNARLEELEQELTATKEHLQTYIEELETSNEELQSLNEELQSTNEELQSSNEELETSNEELQSTNEEVQIAYAELKSVNEELERKETLLKENQSNLQALLSNRLQAFLLVDLYYKVVAFNSKAEELFWLLRRKRLRPGDSVIDFLLPAQLEDFIRDFSKALQDEVVTSELVFEPLEQQELYFAVNYTPVRQETGEVKGLSISFLDTTGLKQAIVDKSISDRLLAAVFDAVSVGLVVKDANGLVLDVNRHYCEMFGYDRQDLVGQSFVLVVPPADRAQALEEHKQFMFRDVWPAAEVIKVRKDGSPLVVKRTFDKMSYAKGRMVCVTSVTDISQMKDAERQVRASEARYRAMMENALTSILLATPQGVITDVNQAGVKLFRVDSQADLIGKDLTTLLQPQDKAAKALLSKMGKEGQYAATVAGKRTDGSQFIVEIASSIYKDRLGNDTVLVMLHDVTSTREAMWELELLADNTQEYFILFDRDMRVRASNRPTADLVEKYLHKALRKGMSFADLANHAWGIDPVNGFAQVLGGQTEELDWVVNDTEKGDRFFRLKLSPGRNELHEIVGVFLFAFEITEIKKQQDALSRLNVQLLKQAEELAVSNRELEQFAYIASHDLQEPLRMVSGFVSQLETRYAHLLDDKGLQYIHLAVEGAKRMRQIILDLLEFSRVGSMEARLEPVNLQELVAEIAFLVQKNPEAEEESKIIATDLPVVIAGKAPLQQLLFNLITNAIKYRKDHEPPRVEVMVHERESSWEFVVADNGIGISPENFDRIFVIFQRLHPSGEYGGTGMGLAIAKKLAEHLGGSIWVDSEEGVGSRFHFTIRKAAL